VIPENPKNKFATLKEIMAKFPSVYLDENLNKQIDRIKSITLFDGAILTLNLNA
jgi:hypothetical protein